MEWWEKYMSVPFLEKGRDEKGVDCWGLVRLVYQNELNISLPDYREFYDDTKDIHNIKYVTENQWPDMGVRIEAHERECFDIIVLKIQGAPTHLSICTKKQWMLHSSAGVGVSHEKIYSVRWRDRIQGFYRHHDRCRSAVGV